MPVTISRAQRDAIYEMVINHLTAIGDVWMSVDRRQFATAKRMGREFREGLRLLEDLGWSETIDRETVALTVPPDELTQTLARLHKDAAGSATSPPPRRSARSSASSPNPPIVRR
jgi:hypothetical protein